MIFVDSREKKNSHILSYFDRHEIEYAVRKLDVGDYMDSDNPFISVDTKRSIDELSTNLTNRADKARFMAEVRRAFDGKIKLVILIESNKYHSADELRTWKSEYSRVRGGALVKAIKSISAAYGVEFLFAPKISTARKIVEILSCNPAENDL